MRQSYLFLRKLILPLEQIDKSLPKDGRIADLGCGQGIVAAYIAKNKSRDVIGIDSNVKRLDMTKSKNLKFVAGDITKINLGVLKGAVISDVLHHVTPSQQQVVLKKVFASLKKNGVLVIKEIDTDEFTRSRLSRTWDFLFYPKDKIYFNSATYLKETLKKIGFKKITISRPCRFFPGSTTLFVCTK